MSLKILVDMNLSPQWAGYLNNQGISALHWSSLGDPRAKDDVIMRYAKDNDMIVFTNDLDFGTILALTQASAPSVIQMRTENVLPEYLGSLVVGVMKKYADQLERGALVVLEESSNRLRILPLF